MSSKHKKRVRITGQDVAFCVACYIDTKDKICSFLTETKACTKSTFPIIINGRLCFSLYEFRGDFNYFSALLISKSGIAIITKLCKDLTTEKEMYAILVRYFTKYLKAKNPNEYNIILRILPDLVYHYYLYRDNKELYDTENMSGRYLCIMRPLNRETYKGINALLTKISIKNEDVIHKYQIYH